MRQQANVGHCMSRRVQRLQLDGTSDLDYVARFKTHIDTRDIGAMVGQQLGARRGDHLAVASGMITMLMGIQHLGDVPVMLLRSCKTSLMVQWVDRQGLPTFRASDQVVKVA